MSNNSPTKIRSKKSLELAKNEDKSVEEAITRTGQHRRKFS